MKETKIGNQVWSDLLDIDIPGSVKINGIRYYTWKQAIEAAKKFAELYGREWRLPTKEDFIALAKEVNYNPDKLVALGFVKARYYLDGSVDYAGNFGYYWSSAWLSATYAYILYFNSGGVWPQNINNKYYGQAVRCVKDLSPKRDKKGRFVKQNKETNMENEKLQCTAEPEKLSIKDRICLKFILLAIKILRPICYESQEIEEIKKML